MSELNESGDAVTLRQLREAQHLTQQRIAIPLGITQDQVSRLEQRRDHKVSTLRSYVEALGGRLSIVVELPNQGTFALSVSAPLDSVSNKHAKLRDSKPARRHSRQLT